MLDTLSSKFVINSIILSGNCNIVFSNNYDGRQTTVRFHYIRIFPAKQTLVTKIFQEVTCFRLRFDDINPGMSPDQIRHVVSRNVSVSTKWQLE